MGIFIGTDEAGYGPNLGPLVITATAWQVPGDPREFDFFAALAEIVSQRAEKSSSRIHVADSKDVYSPARGLDSLETSVLTLLRLLDWKPGSFRLLCRNLSQFLPDPDSHGNAPWNSGNDLPIPQQASLDAVEQRAQLLLTACESAGIRLLAVRSEIVSPDRFNSLCETHGNKATALSRTTLSLIRSLWDPDSDAPTLIVGDKHGGRNRYDDLIDDQLDGQMIFRLSEGKERSTYRVGSTELRFQMRAESHFPVAVSSMVCKYVRELAMELFNRFWQEHLPDLKPTKGYPVDAKRFREEIAETQRRLGISDNVLWRNR